MTYLRIINLLKKSFRRRSLADMLLNSKYFVILRIDSYDVYEHLRHSFKDKGLGFRFFTESDMLFSQLNVYTKGCSLLIFSDEPFIDELKGLLAENEFFSNILVLKHLSLFSYFSYKKYKKSDFQFLPQFYFLIKQKVLWLIMYFNVFFKVFFSFFFLIRFRILFMLKKICIK
jgi:hypothetical protein